MDEVDVGQVVGVPGCVSYFCLVLEVTHVYGWSSFKALPVGINTHFDIKGWYSLNNCPFGPKNMILAFRIC